MAGRRAAVAFAALVGLALWGCARDEHELTAPSNQAPSFSVAGGQQPDFGPALAVHRRHTARLIAIHGVVGTAVGVRADGRPAVKVFTKETGVAGLPDNLEGIPVEVQVTGEFFAMPCSPNNCTNTNAWPTPVPIGVSTGSNASCIAGTIGARVKAGSAVYALSNNHVYAEENSVPIGTNVLQPGLIDTQCSPSGSNNIGTLSAFAPINFCSGNSCPDNIIDAAIAISDVTKLDNKTPPLGGYGWPNSVVRAAALGQSVKKYGRTTSLTTGVVTGIDATILVGYLTGNAQFVNQIVVSSCPTVCTRPGDSGSLFVTNDASANPVGLLFAGNTDGSSAIANKVGDVLTYFGVTVDATPSPVASGGLTANCGVTCGTPRITSVTSSGATITVKDNGGHTATITLSGFTASGGLTANCGVLCGTAAITAVTASGSNKITVKDNGGHTGTITLSGAKASGGLTANCGVMCGTAAITSVTASSSYVFLKDNGNNTGYITLFY